MNKRLAVVVALVLTLGLALVAEAGLAQTTGTGGGAGGTTAPGTPGAGPSHGREIDLPIGAPLEGFEDEDEPEPDPPDEDDDPTFFDEDIPVRNESLIYVIDISGSMGWDTYTFPGLDGRPQTGNRLDRAKVELQRSISQLTEEYTFNIVAYDCYMRRWRPARAQATTQNKTSGMAFAASLRPEGATGTGPAVCLALGDRENLTIVLLSDGAPNCGASSTSGHRNMIRSQNSQRATINAFGIGAYGEFERFLRDVASDSGGQYFPVN